MFLVCSFETQVETGPSSEKAGGIQCYTINTSMPDRFLTVFILVNQLLVKLAGLP